MRDLPPRPADDERHSLNGFSGSYRCGRCIADTAEPARRQLESEEGGECCFPWGPARRWRNAVRRASGGSRASTMFTAGLHHHDVRRLCRPRSDPWASRLPSSRASGGRAVGGSPAPASCACREPTVPRHPGAGRARRHPTQAGRCERSAPAASGSARRRHARSAPQSDPRKKRTFEPALITRGV